MGKIIGVFLPVSFIMCALSWQYTDELGLGEFSKVTPTILVDA